MYLPAWVLLVRRWAHRSLLVVLVESGIVQKAPQSNLSLSSHRSGYSEHDPSTSASNFEPIPSHAFPVEIYRRLAVFLGVLGFREEHALVALPFLVFAYAAWLFGGLVSFLLHTPCCLLETAPKAFG